MRGTHDRGLSKKRILWIIPAYAGNTVAWIRVGKPVWDHPRVCGEHLAILFALLRLVGSSPRMRGTRTRKCAEENGAGIIPAYAGNTAAVCAVSMVLRDHPRVCGEHDPHATRRAVPTGSSPRMRGTRLHLVPPMLAGGIIPAYAGNTKKPVGTTRTPRDHPRVCGEHTEVTPC